MTFSFRSSRQRFRDYRSRFNHRNGRSNATAPGSGPGRDSDDNPGGKSGGAGASGGRRTRSFWVLFTDFLRLVSDYRPTILFSLGTVTVSTILGLVPLYGTKIVFDFVLTDRPAPGWLAAVIPGTETPRSLLWAVAGMMIGFSMLSLLVGIIGRWRLTRTTQRVQAQVQRQVFEHSMRLPLYRVYQMKSGGLASLLSEDVASVGHLLFALLYNPWGAIIQLIGSLTILTWTDWRLLAGSLVIFPVVWITHRTWIGRIRPMYRDIRYTRQQMSAHATEVFAGMRVVRGFNRQRREAARFTGTTHFRARQELHTWWWARGVDIAWSIMIPVATAGVLGYGGYRILEDAAAVSDGSMDTRQALTPGDLVMFLTYLGWLLGPIATLAASATQFQNSLAGLDRVLDILAEPKEFPSNPAARRIESPSVSAAVTLHDVWFTYPEGLNPVIHGVNLDVLPGQTVALVGHSGSGKTTLCNLIARFFDPTRGRIELDGIDLRNIRISSYRSLLGIVEQDVFLFDGTVAENIAYAHRWVDRDRVVEVAHMANAHEFISQLDDGYETVIGERGVKLSGGQRQRLAIARAMIADPKILILDEATSSLDTASERLIQVSLETLMDNRTSFVIAHRLSTIRHADLIIVLESGKVAEMGKHDELMERSGKYRYMVELQTHPPPGTPGTLGTPGLPGTPTPGSGTSRGETR